MTKASTKWLLPLLVFMVATVVFTWPLPRHLTGQKIYLGSDPILIHAILEWERFALFNDISRFFDGNFYYLTPGSLFFGDLLLGALPLYVVAAWILGPVGGFNIVYLSLYILNGMAMYLLLLRLTGNRWASLLGGAIFAFAPIQQFYLSNHQMLMAWWTPLMLWSLLGALKRRPTRNFAGATLFLLLQFATSIYWGFFALWAFVIFMLITILSGGYSVGRAGAIRCLLVGGIPVAAVFLPIAVGYFRFAQEWQSVRSVDDVIYQSATLPDYFEVVQNQGWTALQGFDFLSLLRPYLISGLSGLVLAVAGLVSLVALPRYRVFVVFSALIVVTSFILSLGPVLKLHGDPTDVVLPYQFLYDHFPGVPSLRAVSRWVLSSHLGISMLAGVGFAGLWIVARSLGRWRIVLVVVAFAVLAIDFGRPEPPRQNYPEATPLKDVLRTLPRDPAIFVPMVENLEARSRYMAWSAESSALPLLNGYNGYVPPTQEHIKRLVNGANLSESADVYASLHALGVRTVILDMANLQSGSHESWMRALADTPEGSSSQGVDRFTVLRLSDDGWMIPISSWGAIGGELFLSNVAAGSTLVAPLNLVNHTSSPWLSPISQGTYTLDVRWEPKSGGTVQSQSARFQPPPVISAMGVAVVPAKLSVPHIPDDYRLKLSFDGHELATVTLSVYSSAVAPPPKDLAADLRLLDVSRVVRSGESIRLSVSATNRGSETWDGDVRLGYRWWFRGDSAIPSNANQNEGRIFIELDRNSPWAPVAPGSAYTFSGIVDTPQRIGRYSLVLGMVKEGVAWFGEELLDIHVVARDSETIPPVVEQLGLEGDIIMAPSGETYRILSGNRRTVRLEESPSRTSLVERRVRLASSIEVAGIHQADSGDTL
ncbi:MAG: hypothetical protein OXR64_12610 [Chloroflexota bacterium]|nr:hypothetical protein [Chloroflexota bacterium]MDE2920668.1 hypothetical protein [Chloroflexota bacterium]